MGLSKDQKTGVLRAYSNSILQQEILIEAKTIAKW